MPFKKLSSEEKFEDLIKKPVKPDVMQVENGHFDIREMSDSDFKQYIYEYCETIKPLFTTLVQLLSNTDFDLQVLLKHLKVDVGAIRNELYNEYKANANKELAKKSLVKSKTTKKA